MIRILRALSALIALFAATPALAIDTSFHTYDGFAETVDAFRLVSMIFGDPRYETLVLIVAVVGIALGVLAKPFQPHVLVRAIAACEQRLAGLPVRRLPAGLTLFPVN